MPALLAQYSFYNDGLWPGTSRQVAGPAMTDKFRQAADSENFPYGEDTTPFIMVKSGKVTWASRNADKIAMLKERGGKILAVWPGKWSLDVFEVNDRVRALAALGDSASGTAAGQGRPVKLARASLTGFGSGVVASSRPGATGTCQSPTRRNQAPCHPSLAVCAPRVPPWLMARRSDNRGQ
jgi:hypothetical protein